MFAHRHNLSHNIHERCYRTRSAVFTQLNQCYQQSLAIYGVENLINDYTPRRKDGSHVEKRLKLRPVVVLQPNAQFDPTGPIRTSR
jgi:hypothetical protein